MPLASWYDRAVKRPATLPPGPALRPHGRPPWQDTPIFEEVFEAASVFDINGNGYISAEELRHVMKELGEGLDAATLDAMIKVAEPDSEGQVRLLVCLGGLPRGPLTPARPRPRRSTSATL